MIAWSAATAMAKETRQTEIRLLPSHKPLSRVIFSEDKEMREAVMKNMRLLLSPGMDLRD